jgi:glycosyltransferase involved in cell wall biosynthesis
MKICTYTFSNLDRTDGPVIHFMELWNAFNNQFKKEFELKGFAFKTEEGKQLLIQPNFSLVTPVKKSNKLIRLIHQDLLFAISIFKNRKNVIYLRTANNAFISAIVAAYCCKILITEYNGIAKADADSNKANKIFINIVRKIETLLIKKSAGCIAVSKGIEEYLKSVGAKQTITILNGVSPSFLSVNSTSNKPLKIVYVGTFTPWDGAIRIVELAKTNKNIEFHFLGKGDYMNDVTLKASTLSNVFFHGFVQYGDLPSEYQKYDAGIVLYEFKRNDMVISSLKTLEYMACGLPIFSTEVPGQEFIANEKIGMLCNFDNIKEKFDEFINSIDELTFNCNKYRQTIGDEFTWNRVARQTNEFIKLIISNIK